MLLRFVVSLFGRKVRLFNILISYKLNLKLRNVEQNENLKVKYIQIFAEAEQIAL